MIHAHLQESSEELVVACPELFKSSHLVGVQLHGDRLSLDRPKSIRPDAAAMLSSRAGRRAPGRFDGPLHVAEEAVGQCHLEQQVMIQDRPHDVLRSARASLEDSLKALDVKHLGHAKGARLLQLRKTLKNKHMHHHGAHVDMQVQAALTQ